MEIKVMENQNQVYQKDKLLGEGAFGKAYLVRHKHTAENLVIKEMNIQHMSNKQKEETIKEAQILKNLNHPNIVNFKEVYITKNNKLKIVMEYAECGDLAKAIAGRKAKKNYFEESHILDWFTQICLAIKHVHDRKILHRDIKGQNIFIAKNNSLKLGDFGIARVLNKTHEKARTVVGTPYYLSPEIIENKPYSFKSDIWSIGAVLYELCALSPPFTATSLQMLALKIVKGTYQPIQGNYSQNLKNLIAQMLTLDPNHRPNINDVLQKPIIKQRIRNFLSQTKRVSEFSHTILHNQKVEILANKLVQIQKQKQTPGSDRPQSRHGSGNNSKQKNIQKERQKLKDDQAKMELLMQKKKEEERRKSEKKRDDQARKREEEKRRKEQDKRKWIKYEQEKKQQMQKQYEENMRRQRDARKYQEQREYQRKIQAENQRRKQYEYEEQRWRENQDQKKRNKMMQEQKKKQELNDFARKQYFQNLEIRKRAQERARRQQEGYQSEVISEEPLQQPNFHYRPSSNQQARRNSRDRPSSRQDKPNNSDFYQKPKLQYPQPTEEQIQNAYVNPNFNKKRSTQQKKSIEPKPPQKRGSVSNIGSDEKIDSRKKIDDGRQKMKKDREEFIRNQGKEKSQREIVGEEQPVKVGKWGKKRSTSRENKEKYESPRFKQSQQTQQQIESGKNEEGKGFNTLIQDSQNLFLEAKSPLQFQNYVDELEGILNNINKAIQVLPEIPVQKQVVFREDDELQFSLTAEEPLKKGVPEMDVEEVDLDYFSNYSKLQTLRIQLQEAFGVDNFILLYRNIEKQVAEKGLDGFDLISTMKEVGNEIDGKVISKNITLLLTLVTLEDKMSYT